MACFLRGLGSPCLVWSQPAMMLMHGPATRTGRFFASSIGRARKQVQADTLALAQAMQTGSRYAFLTKLAAKPSPTVLYQAPSHFWFYFTCWSTGISMIGWSALTAPVILDQPEGVPDFTKHVYAVSYLLLCAMGFYLIAKTPNVVNSIRLLPSNAASTPGASSSMAAAAAKLQLEVTVKHMLPMLPLRTITTGIENVSFKTRLSHWQHQIPESKLLEMERLEETRRAELRKFDMDHILTMPFRRIGRGLQSLFQGVKSAWTGAGFGFIKVNGKEYKVDVTGGFSHATFRTLARIVDTGA
ncbi:hypothetical protein L249_6434 [Ophiocordyceps polyrhachis-furcata BCC 54312]|uniref:Uncharacterized protein n=1 Tax=Ophiocordyceps polyrhachis-furcata BCC 54312 TaxID=1330021 RepID=A0A367LJV2_9HYPO|nr:hypothetical protein L249_6434 [Ophiocordyceps polyrhachis-furcata BCC 54312]